MNMQDYRKIEDYMLLSMDDSAHDRDHIYRVLYMALDIAQGEDTVNYDVLIAAALLHDIGRKAQFANPSVCHAEAGAEQASVWLMQNGYATDMAEAVSHCIRCHRFRSDRLPATIEAKIIFDADKLDATGTLGIARSLFYKGQVGEPLYSLGAGDQVLDGGNDGESPSFFHEYKYKLERLYDRFFTVRGRDIALTRQQSAIDFYQSMLSEAQSCYANGSRSLNSIIGGATELKWRYLQ